MKEKEYWIKNVRTSKKFSVIKYNNQNRDNNGSVLFKITLGKNGFGLLLKWEVNNLSSLKEILKSVISTMDKISIQAATGRFNELYYLNLHKNYIKKKPRDKR